MFIHDLYNGIVENTTYNKIVGRNYLIVEYKCPIESELFRLLANTHFLLYVVSGKKDWFVSGKTYELKEGDALFLRKGVYNTRQHHDTDHCVMLFFMNDDFIKDFMRENNYSKPIVNGEIINDQVFEINVNDPLKNLFLSIFGYLKSDYKIPQNLVELKFHELMFNIVLNPKHQKLTGFFSSLHNSSKVNFEQVMMKHFKYDLSIPEFAGLCGRSLSAFKRDFRNHYNQTPGEWLKNRRLELAHDLLLTTGLNVNEVSTEAGFKNTTHFNRIFREKYQLPPNRYRSQYGSLAPQDKF